MKLADEIIELFDYSRWARLKLIAAIPPADRTDPFVHDLSEDSGSIRKKFVHIMSAELVWFDRLGFDGAADSPSGMLPEDTVASREELMDHWKNIDRKYDALLQRIAEDNSLLDHTVTYRNLAGTEFSSTIREILMHVAMHGMYHRGQIASLLRRLGGPIVSTDMIGYFRELKKG